MFIVRPTHPQILDLCSQIDAIGDELSALDLAGFTFPASVDALSQRLSWVLSQRLSELLTKVVTLDEACAQTPGWQEVGNVCFVSAVQLRGVRRRLAEHHGYEDLLVACESGLRHVRRMVQAIRDAVRDASGEPRDLAPAIFADEIAAALTVRRLYNNFRRALAPCAGNDRPAVVRALQYAAGALATLVGAHDFPVVRASDRLLILRLQSRVIGWARSGGSVDEGLRLAQDVETAAELLRGVNQRQELRAHDEALAAKLAATAPANLTELARYWNELAELDGHDDELDRLIAATRDGGLDSAQLGRLQAALLRIARHDDDGGALDLAQTPLAK